jgi:hypothetical protein
MRTTINLDDDVAAAAERLRRDAGLGLSEAVNELARRGLAAPRRRKAIAMPSHDLGLKIDISNIQEALDEAEGADRR